MRPWRQRHGRREGDEHVIYRGLEGEWSEGRSSFTVPTIDPMEIESGSTGYLPFPSTAFSSSIFTSIEGMKVVRTIEARLIAITIGHANRATIRAGIRKNKPILSTLIQK